MKHLKSFEAKQKPGKAIYVLNDQYTEVTREADPDDEWGADDTYTNNHIYGIELSESDYGDISSIPFEIVPDKDYYLLYVIYSTGDSFSHHEGRIDYVELYDNRELAEASAKMIEDDYNKYKMRDEGYSVTILNSKGEPFKMSCAWKGYFESLDTVDIETVRLK